MYENKLRRLLNLDMQLDAEVGNISTKNMGCCNSLRILYTAFTHYKSASILHLASVVGGINMVIPLKYQCILDFL